MTEILNKTKILATIGPSSDSEDNLKKLIDTGVSGFRLNFSHGTEEYFESLFKRIYQVCEERKLPIPILQDLQGPKIRIGKLEFDEIEIVTGELIEITVDDVIGNKEIISTSYKDLVNDSAIGDEILINDGLIKLKVAEKKDKSVVCNILEGGILRPKKGMNLPGMQLTTESITEKDKSDMEFAFQHRVDYVALSFVRSAEDIISLRKWMEERGFNKQIVAKIEKPEAVENFEEILEVSDAIMVARGDLGVELGSYQIPVIQKRIIRRCNEVGKLVITATQMLESMINNPTPTRAESTDVANAVLDGSDVVMLSGETAAGKYPVESVRTMRNLILQTESQDQFKPIIDWDSPKDIADNIFDATCRAFVDISNQIKAKALIVFTHEGRKAKNLSKFNPDTYIYAFSDSFETLNDLNLHKGIKPFYIKNIMDEDFYIKKAKEKLIKNTLISTGDLVIFTAGAPISDVNRKNWIRFLVV
ncbi:MAG: pyruvate kinase [Melioribacteraceae bacterium]|nr:pyruvate kinase [Melioribacteraceae bacterium]